MSGMSLYLSLRKSMDLMARGHNYLEMTKAISAQNFTGILIMKTGILTVDYWISKSACDEFQKKFSAEYEALDKICASLTEKENSLGSFHFD